MKFVRGSRGGVGIAKAAKHLEVRVGGLVVEEGEVGSGHAESMTGTDVEEVDGRCQCFSLEV